MTAAPVPDARGASPALDRVARGRLCAGCGACAALAPEAVRMALSPEGWLRPVVAAPVPPAAETAIAAVCPGLTVEQPAAPPVHPLWGPVVALRTGHATDPALRRTASSGGVLSALLADLLATGTVDFVLQTAADPANPLGNATVESRTPAAVAAAAGSRYAPSAPLAGIGAVLARGERFAFVGKPCDVAALRAMARRDPRIDRLVPVMISFFCAGVPSLAGARAICDRLGVDPAAVTAFRYRGDGWPGFAAATLADGTVRRMSYAESWGGILSGRVQFRCKICPDGTGGLADVVCADAWESDAEGYPVFEERDGVSLVMARTARGEALVAGAMARGAIAAGPLDPGAIAAMQPGQAGRKRHLLARLAALALLGRPRPRYRGFTLAAAARGAALAGQARNFLGLLRRALAGRLD